MFEEVQNRRVNRVSKVVAMGHQRQKMDAMETPELEQLMLHKFPLSLPGVLIDRWDQTFAPAVSLKSPALPARPKQVLFQDEKQQSQETVTEDARL
jgi:hypothetical protein